MTLEQQIDIDCNSMEHYFKKLFTLLDEAISDEKNIPIEVCDINVIPASYHSISHFIKPDMLTNIYSLVDFWMNELCDYCQKRKQLSLSRKDIKGTNDFDARQKYLTLYAHMDLTAVENSFKRLDELRQVRNVFMHSGGYPSENQQKEFVKIDGITVDFNLIYIDKNFVWSTLKHARVYLRYVAEGISLACDES